MSTIARAITLVMDYRQTSTYPDGQFIHLFARFITAALGTVATPTLPEKGYTAFIFLALAVQHFRDIHKMRQKGLNNLEPSGYARHGDAHIDRISKTYEARNYTSMVSSMTASSAVLLMESLSRALAMITAAALRMLSVFLLKRFTRRKWVGDICVIQQGEIQIQGSNLLVDNVYVTGAAGSPVARKLFLQQGPGVVITPKKERFRATLEDVGQRQAILYGAASTLGVRTYQYVKRNVKQDKMAIALIPVDRNTGRMIAAIQNTPVLENSRRIRRIISR